MGEKPLFKKLRILPGQKILLFHAPDNSQEQLGDLPEGTRVETNSRGTYDLVQAFFTQPADLAAQVDEIKAALVENSILWVCYPKQSAKMESELNRDTLREQMAEQNLKAVSLVSVDATWSAMRFKQI